MLYSSIDHSRSIHPFTYPTIYSSMNHQSLFIPPSAAYPLIIQAFKNLWTFSQYHQFIHALFFYPSAQLHLNDLSILQSILNSFSIWLCIHPSDYMDIYEPLIILNLHPSIKTFQFHPSLITRTSYLSLSDPSVILSNYILPPNHATSSLPPFICDPSVHPLTLPFFPSMTFPSPLFKPS